MKEIDWSNLSFGYMKTDYNVRINFREGEWGKLEISSSELINLHMAATCLHYGQEAFEGLKAFRGKDGKVRIFRLEENAARLQSTCRGIMMAELPTERFKEAVLTAVKMNERFIPPYESGASLYIRPFIFAADPFLGVRPGEKYYFMIIMSPSGAYYSTGINPVNIYVETNYLRAEKVGMGFTKNGGNYAASLAGQDEAHWQNYSQVLWLDGVERKYIEEVGAMNIMFVIDGEVVTPSLQGSILSGITRKSALELCRKWGMKVSERRITIQEVADAYDAGKLDEVFGTGTAAVVSPVGHLKWGDKVMEIGGGKIGPITQKLYDTMTGMQFGKIPDDMGWIEKL